MYVVLVQSIPFKTNINIVLCQKKNVCCSRIWDKSNTFFSVWLKL